MVTAQAWRLMHRLEENAKIHGMKVVQSKYGGDLLALTPLDDELPIYSRDVELACGDATHLESVLHGWDSAMNYLIMLNAITKTKITTKESEYNQKRLAAKLKTGFDLERLDK